MSTKLRVKDFQSIGETELEIDGFTVITGPNNAGKSALVRSVIGLFSNYSGVKHGWVRKGSKSLSVSLEFEDGNAILWERGPKIARYVINGKPFENVGQRLPEEVSTLGVRSLKVGSETLWPQIASQFIGQLFLVHQTGSVLAEAIADVDRVGKINRALRLGESYRREAASMLKLRRKDSDELAAKIHALEGLDDLQTRVAELELQRTETLAQAHKIQTATALRTKLVEAQEAIEALQGIGQIQLADPSKARKCRELLKQFLALRTKLESAQEALSRFKGISKVEVDSTDNAKKAYKLLKEAKLLKVRLLKYEGVLDQTKDLEVSLEGDWETPGTVAEELRALQVLRRRLASGRSSVEALTEELTQKELEFEQLRQEVLESLGDLEECPTCGKNV